MFAIKFYPTPLTPAPVSSRSAFLTTVISTRSSFQLFLAWRHHLRPAPSCLVSCPCTCCSTIFPPSSGAKFNGSVPRGGSWSLMLILTPPGSSEITARYCKGPPLTVFSRGALMSGSKYIRHRPEDSSDIKENLYDLGLLNRPRGESDSLKAGEKRFGKGWWSH